MFEYLIVIEPLGFLYGSVGRFLSPENLVGRSGTSFPPSAASLSGLFAAAYNQTNKNKLDTLQLAGPFWAKGAQPENFYVPTPFNCLVLKGEKSLKYQLSWHGNKWLDQCGKSPADKFESGTWIAIQDWKQLDSPDWNNPPQVEKPPWKPIPHLHPQLREDERRVKIEQLDDGSERGSLFLENAMQLDPDACLVYLSNTDIEPGWYRFGGEGHMVAVKCVQLAKSTKENFNKPLEKSFALITPAVWGSNRLSTRFPMMLQCDHPQQKAWEIEALLTERPHPYRYRMGGQEKTKRLSRGRYAVPAGTVYIVETPLNLPWQNWYDSWFPYEGYSFKRWGCGLALPLNTEPSGNQEGK